MVCRSDVIVPVSLNTLDRVVGIETKFIKNLLINTIFDRHEFIARKQAYRLLVSKLAVPWVLPDLHDAISLIGVRLQDFGQEVRAVGGEKAR